MKRISEIIVLVLIIFGLYYGLEFLKGRIVDEVPPEIIRPVKTVVINDGSRGRKLIYYGTLQGGQRVVLSFKVPGTLKDVLVNRGDAVRKGELLARLDPRDFQTQLKQAQSRQTQAKAQYEDALANFKRYENLYKQKVIPRATYDTYKTQVEVTKSALGVATAQTASARDTLRDTELRAPFSGVVVDKLVENYEDVTAKSGILSLQDISNLQVVFNVPDNEIIWISPNAQMPSSIVARFDAIPDRTFPLKYREAVFEADQNTHTFAITMEMLRQERDVNLLPGMSANVEIQFEGTQTQGQASFVIPSSAIFSNENRKDEKIYVWRYENEEVHQIQVTASQPQNNGFVSIYGKGLKDGDRIVVAGTHLLREGQKVRLMN